MAKRKAVIYVVRGAHIQLMTVSISSLLRNYNSDEKIDLIIIEDDLDTRDKEIILSLPEIYNKHNINIKFNKPPKISDKIKAVKTEIGDMTLWRLFLPLEYPEYEQILYLDNDTIIYCDISELFDNTDINKLIGAVRDFYFYVDSEVVNLSGNFGLENLKNYVNSGIIVFNVDNYVSSFSEEYLIDTILSNTYSWPDQTIINRICVDNISYLPLQYNYQKNDEWLYNWALNRHRESASDILEARKNVKIRHFIEFGRLSMPWQHLRIENKFELDFYEYLYFIKKYLGNRLLD
ncbi:glycosyltransferase [Gemelliphila palaticanis]|uniref:Glycosyltransferase family 8 protein n=1 Tax=Gemelliphila palaticanis TaxID=81950 RepID=A0ABX2T2Y0_9BACL|nr:glycosyltransferase [Gemella palaticanis]MBF0716053.1 glycosyltransferase family 8 protein [Gemella palaticanis]NYS47983.1 glycosyltransferase family 8 protein [Gemella palaticanis]